MPAEPSGSQAPYPSSRRSRCFPKRAKESVSRTTLAPRRLRSTDGICRSRALCRSNSATSWRACSESVPGGNSNVSERSNGFSRRMGSVAGATGWVCAGATVGGHLAAGIVERRAALPNAAKATVTLKTAAARASGQRRGLTTGICVSIMLEMAGAVGSHATARSACGKAAAAGAGLIQLGSDGSCEARSSACICSGVSISSIVSSSGNPSEPSIDMLRLRSRVSTGPGRSS